MFSASVGRARFGPRRRGFDGRVTGLRMVRPIRIDRIERLVDRNMKFHHGKLGILLCPSTDSFATIVVTLWRVGTFQ